MKLYYHPASTTSRLVLLFAAEQKNAPEPQVIDLFSGEHCQPPYEAINPNPLVPVPQDGDFRLTESSAILKYLAGKIDSPLYPKELQARARVNERMDWVNTQLCRDLAYGTVYPQIFPFHKRPSEEAQSVQPKWGCERAQGWLKCSARACSARRIRTCAVRRSRSPTTSPPPSCRWPGPSAATCPPIRTCAPGSAA